MELSLQHPKRVFMRNAIDYEIRLSYYDRVLKTLPEPMQNPDNRIVPSAAPGPDYEYDDPGTSHLRYRACSNLTATILKLGHTTTLRSSFWVSSEEGRRQKMSCPTSSR